MKNISLLEIICTDHTNKCWIKKRKYSEKNNRFCRRCSGRQWEGDGSDLNAKETLRRKQDPKAVDALKQRAIVESVKGNNAIEGIVTTDDRILNLVKGAVPVSHDEKEISRYKDALSTRNWMTALSMVHCIKQKNQKE